MRSLVLYLKSFLKSGSFVILEGKCEKWSFVGSNTLNQFKSSVWRPFLIFAFNSLLTIQSNAISYVAYGKIVSNCSAGIAALMLLAK